MVNVFFAIWPNNKVRYQLDDLSEKLELVCGGRRIVADNIHLTLIFLGEIEASLLDQLLLVANTVKGRSFNFIVDRTHYWQCNRIVCAGTDKVPLELFDLVSFLKKILSANGFSFDQRAFTPHITLVRKVSHHDLPNSLIHLEEPIIWPVHEWLLVKSERDSDRSVYTSIGRWPLASHR